MKSLSERLQDYVRLSGCHNVSEFSQKTGVPASTLCEVFKGRTTSLSTKNAKKICDFVGCSMDELLGIPAKEGIQDELYEKRKLLFDMSKKATEQDLDYFIKMLEAIIPNG